MKNNHADTQKANKKSPLGILGKVLLTLVGAVAVFALGTLISLLLMSEGIHVAITYIVGYLLPALLLPLIWLKNKKKYLRLVLVAAAVCLVVTGVNFGMARHDQSIRVETSSWSYIYDVTAEDAFVFIVHQDNPVDGLTTEQLQGIFSGTITNWSELGGENKQIVAYQCEEDAVNQKMMVQFMGDAPLMAPPVEMGYGDLYGWEELVSPYRNKPASIGFCFTSYLLDAPDVKLLEVDGVAPTRENIQNGTYPIVTPQWAIVSED